MPTYKIKHATNKVIRVNHKSYKLANSGYIVLDDYVDDPTLELVDDHDMKETESTLPAEDPVEFLESVEEIAEPAPTVDVQVEEKPKPKKRKYTRKKKVD